MPHAFFVNAGYCAKSAKEWRYKCPECHPQRVVSSQTTFSFEQGQTSEGFEIYNSCVRADACSNFGFPIAETGLCASVCSCMTPRLGVLKSTLGLFESAGGWPADWLAGWQVGWRVGG